MIFVLMEVGKIESDLLKEYKSKKVKGEALPAVDADLVRADENSHELIGFDFADKCKVKNKDGKAGKDKGKKIDWVCKAWYIRSIDEFKEKLKAKQVGLNGDVLGMWEMDGKPYGLELDELGAVVTLPTFPFQRDVWIDDYAPKVWIGGVEKELRQAISDRDIDIDDLPWPNI